MFDVVCPGECCVDWYADDPTPRCGGISFNVALHATRAFGKVARVTLVSALGDDVGGAEFRRQLGTLQVRHDLTIGPGRTPSIQIALDEHGDRTFGQYDSGVLGNWEPGSSQRALIAASDLMVTTRFTGIEATFDRLLALPAGGLRAVDFADIGDTHDVAMVKRYVQDIDIGFFGIAPTDKSLLQDLTHLAAASGKLFVITLGAAGSLAVRGEQVVRCEAVPVDRVVDTTGAGDCFAAWFLSRFLQGAPLQACLEAGAAAAADIIRQPGTFHQTDTFHQPGSGADPASA